MYGENETKPFILLEIERLGYIMIGIIATHVLGYGYQFFVCSGRQSRRRPLGVSCS